MTANLLVVAFVLAMAYWWGVQGFFSGFLHLLVVIVAGAMAFALWEPASHWLLASGTFATLQAWGVALLCLFIVLMLVFRIATDSLVPANVHFSHLIDLIAGGCCGLLSGILTAGIVIIGLGFLPLSQSIAGYAPLHVTPDGDVAATEGGGLWIPVDSMAGNFYEGLSVGALASGKPMAHYRPEPHRQAALFRLSRFYDPKSVLTAVPGAVEIQQVFEHRVAIDPEQITAPVLNTLSQDGQVADRKIVLVETQWNNQKRGVYNSADGRLRLFPPQVRLITWDRPTSPRQVKMVAPIAAVEVTGGAVGFRRFVPLDSDESRITSVSPSQMVGWVFNIPEDDVAKFINLRGLRLALPDPEDMQTDTESLVKALGRRVRGLTDSFTGDADLDAESDQPSEMGQNTGKRAGAVGVAIEINNSLPQHFSSNAAPSLQYNRENQILAGKADVDRPNTRVGQATRIEEVFVPRGLAMVRIELQRDQAQSLLGRSQQAAAALGEVFLRDDRGNPWYPIGYVVKRSNNEQEIEFDRGQPMRFANQIPAWLLRADDKLYLYVQVEAGARVVSYHFGNATQRIDPPLEIPRN